MSLQRPFVRTHEEKKEWGTLTIRFGDKDRELLDSFKELVNIKTDGRAIKYSLKISHSVLHSVFGSDILKYLCQKKRERLSDVKTF